MANDLTISFSFLAQVSGGPQLSVASPTLTVKAYDMIPVSYTHLTLPTNREV